MVWAAAQHGEVKVKHGEVTHGEVTHGLWSLAARVCPVSPSTD